MEGKGRCAFVADVNPYGLEVIYKSVNFHLCDLKDILSVVLLNVLYFHNCSLMLEVDELHMHPLARLHFKTFPKTKQMRVGSDLNDISKILF